MEGNYGIGGMWDDGKRVDHGNSHSLNETQQKKSYFTSVFYRNVHKSRLTRPVTYHTSAKYRKEVAASAIAYRPVSESSSGSFPSITSLPLCRFPLNPQEPGNKLVSPLKLRVSMAGGDHLLFGRSPARLPLKHAIKKSMRATGELVGTIA
ncbi:hypothetical protein EVAR_6590_1 [Eumeta japonica]|uniref:Uncharacterized protein n=1 Tax=Eumeta variegata TaxID=151549 RepID=A0A4C1SR24_EUMVA|nr:hypothetical protein EVAR_6590_1 [Eumeta japonica]